MKPPICEECQAYMLQNEDAVEWLKCPTCAKCVPKVKFGRVCGNCKCTIGLPCKKLEDETDTE